MIKSLTPNIFSRVLTLLNVFIQSVRLGRFPVVSFKLCQDFSRDCICKSEGFSCLSLSGVSMFVLDTMVPAFIVPLDLAVAFLALATHRQTYGFRTWWGRVINTMFFPFGLQLLHQEHTGRRTTLRCLFGAFWWFHSGSVLHVAEIHSSCKQKDDYFKGILG